MIFSKYSFWLKAAIVMQLLTAGLHSMSLIMKPQPTNDTEKQLLDLMNTYEMNMGSGFTPTMGDFLTSFSLCCSLLLILGGALNWLLLAKKVDAQVLKGVIGINALVFGICFIAFLKLTFLVPVICVGLIVAFLLISYILVSKAAA